MNKTAFITGASVGIGRSTAKAFAARGYNLILTYNKNEKEAKKLATELALETRVELFHADLRDYEELKAAVAKAKKVFPSIDILVNNAGIAQKSLFTDLSDNDIDDMLKVNLSGAMILSREVLGGMLSEKRGVIINISSIWGQVGAAMEVHYSAAKAGLIGFTKALAKEVALSGIRVNAICAGAIETAMLKDEDKTLLNESIPLGRTGTPEEVAEGVLFLAENEYITGAVLSIDGGGIY